MWKQRKSILDEQQKNFEIDEQMEYNLPNLIDSQQTKNGEKIHPRSAKESWKQQFVAICLEIFYFLFSETKKKKCLEN